MHPSYAIKPFEDEFKSFKVDQDYVVFGNYDMNYSELGVSQKKYQLP